MANEDMLKQCHKELDGNKAVGIDKVTKDEYGKNPVSYTHLDVYKRQELYDGTFFRTNFFIRV